MIIDYVNAILSTLSIIAAVVSICQAQRAKQYKEATLLLCDILDLEGMYTKFTVESRVFLDKTRDDQWYKGIGASPIISPYKEIISKFGGIYHLMKDPEELKKKVRSLNDIIENYDKAGCRKKKEANTLIFEITETLLVELKSNRKKVI